MGAGHTKHNVKESLFRDIYHHIAYLCDLASFFLRRKVKPEEITIDELEHVFFSGWKNDISFRVGTQWFFLIEQQSTNEEVRSGMSRPEGRSLSAYGEGLEESASPTCCMTSP